MPSAAEREAVFQTQTKNVPVVDIGRTIRSVRPATDRMHVIAEAAAGVIGATSREALRAVLEQACREIIPLDAFFVLAYDAAEHTFQGFGGLDAGHSSPPEVVAASGTPGERVVQDRKSLLTLHADDPTARGARLTGTGRRSQSVIRSPILSGEEVLGLLSVHSYTPGAYTETDVEVVEVIASLAATAFLKARLADERQAAEAALRQREQELREAQRLARMGSWRWALGSDQVNWSDEMFRNYGLPPGDGHLSFADFIGRVHPEDRDTLLSLVEQATTTGLPFELAHRISHTDGTTRVLHCRGEVVHNPEGKPVQLFGTGQDITELKTAEEALRASEESYRSIFELASDAIFVHDLETGAVLDANRKACEMHGCTLDELKAMGVAGISDGRPPYDAENAARFIQLAAEGKPQRFEWRVRRKTGERFWVEVSLHRVRILGDDRILANVRNIDERKEAEAALQRAHDELERRVAERTSELAERTEEVARAEQRFRAIVEASPTPLLLSRIEDGVILYANDRLEMLVGTAPGSLTGRKTPDFYFDPGDRPLVIEQVRRQGYVRDLELRIKRIDGSLRWVSLSVEHLSFNGEPALATALVDITERKQTSDALRASEESYRSLFDNLTELVYVQDLLGYFLNVNEAVLRTYGYTREELIGKSPEMLAAPGMVDLRVTNEHFRLAASGHPQRFEWWGRRKDGSIFPKEVVLKRSTYFGQDVVIAVARDITERVEADAAIRRSEEHFRRLIENASDLISILDANGVIRYESPAVRQMLGYEPEEMVGRSAFDFLMSEDVEPTMERLQMAARQPGTPVFAEFRFRHKDGSWKTIEGVGTTLSPHSAEEGIVVNARDITERKAAEEALRLQKTLLEAQGEASIDGILVVSGEGRILSYNHRFAEMWNIPPDIVAAESNEAALRAVMEQVQDPDAFASRIEHLYSHPDEVARDELALRDGRIFDRYTAPVASSEGRYYGRIWFFRDVTAEKRYADELYRARLEAERATEQASHYAATLERELEFGRKIQQGLFPARLPQPAGWEIAVRFSPVWQVAGDFYDAFELPGGHVGLIIADVSGKGVGAALFMALFQSLLRASAERASAVSVGMPSHESVLMESVSGTNGYITRVHGHAHMFASVFFGLLDPKSGTISYVNAGHEPPVLIGPEGPAKRLRPTGPALGLVPDASFEVASTTLAPGKILLAYTDGVTDARDVERGFFSEARLLSMLASPAQTAAGLLDRIETAVQEFAGDAPRADDLTLLALRRRAPDE